jgi:hypothetical protein
MEVFARWKEDQKRHQERINARKGSHNVKMKEVKPDNIVTAQRRRLLRKLHELKELENKFAMDVNAFERESDLSTMEDLGPSGVPRKPLNRQRSKMIPAHMSFLDGVENLDDTSSANVSFSPERTRGFQVLWSR